MRGVGGSDARTRSTSFTNILLLVARGGAEVNNTTTIFQSSKQKDKHTKKGTFLNQMDTFGN